MAKTKAVFSLLHMNKISASYRITFANQYATNVVFRVVLKVNKRLNSRVYIKVILNFPLLNIFQETLKHVLAFSTFLQD